MVVNVVYTGSRSSYVPEVNTDITFNSLWTQTCNRSSNNVSYVQI